MFRLLRACAFAALSVSAALAATPTPAAANPATLPLLFERNQGQFAPDIAFVARAPHFDVGVTSSSLQFVLTGKSTQSQLTLHYAGAASEPTVTGLELSPVRTNRFVGAPSDYRTDLPNYNRVRVEALYPGISAELYPSNGELEQDFRIAPYADASRLALRWSGASDIATGANGSLRLTTAAGDLELHAPVAFQLAPDGTRQLVSSAYLVDAATRTVRFRLGAYDHARELVIDPVIVYATFAGGSAGSTAGAIATDSTGAAYVSGTTSSSSFGASPSVTKTCGSTGCSNSIFVLKLAANGSASWLTYVGYGASPYGATLTGVYASAANTSRVYVGGSSDAITIASPSGTASQSTQGYDGFVLGLDASSGTLTSTNLVEVDHVNPDNNTVNAMALDASGNLYIGGILGGVVFFNPTPSSNAFAVSPSITGYTSSTTQLAGNTFVMKLDGSNPSTSSPLFFTYIQTFSYLNGLAVDASGRIYVSGYTTQNFRAPSPHTNSSGAFDAFMMSFTPGASGQPTVNGFTWINGDGNTMSSGLAIDGAGGAYLFGNTTADNLQSVLGGSSVTCAIACALPDTGGSGFVVHTNSSGTPTSYSYVAANAGIDDVSAGAYANGALYLTGYTNSAKDSSSGNSPLLGVVTLQTQAAPFNTETLAYGQDTSISGHTHGYVASLNASLGSVNYVANLGGSASMQPTSIAVDSAGNAYVTANSVTGSLPFTTYGAFLPSAPSGSSVSAYVAKIANSTISSGVSLANATGSPSPGALVYSGTTTGVDSTLTWDITFTSAASLSNFLVQVATGNTYYTVITAKVIDVTAGGSNAGSCVIVPNGITCNISAVPQTVSGTNDHLQLVLGLRATSAATGATGSVPVAAVLQGSNSEYSSASQSLGFALPSNLSLALGTPSASRVYATSSSTYTQFSGTTVTYPITLSNTGSSTSYGPANSAALTVTTLPTGFKPISVSVTTSGSATATTCDTTTVASGCSALSIPLGGSVTYSITGYYDQATLFGSSSTATSATSGPIAASATGTSNNISAPSLATNTTVGHGQPALAFSNQTIAYGPLGSSLNASAAFGTSSPAGAFTYTASTTLGGAQQTVTGTSVLTVGAWYITATFTPTDSTNFLPVSKTAAFTINKATATVTLGGLTQTYNGSPLAATASTNPSGLTVNFTYNGSSTAPTAAGSYSVVGTVSDSNYTGTATGTLVIGKASATVSLSNLTATYDGSAHAATVSTSPSGVATAVTYNGSPTAPTAAGSYNVIASITDPNYTGAAGTGTLVISKATASVALSNLSATYDGSPHAATASSTPAGLTVALTYNGSPTAPTAAGSYVVVATVTDTNYTGSASGTLVLNRAPVAITLGNLSATYDGNPHPATASGTPSGHTITLTYNGSATAPTAAGSYNVVATVDESNYTGTASGTLNISKANPTLSWTPSSIAFGTPFSTEMTARATLGSNTVAGTFSYTESGTTLSSASLLSAGAHTVLLSFTPTDSADFNTASLTSTVNVTAITPAVTFTASPAAIYLGASATFTVTFNGTPTTPTGKITFLDGSSVIGSVTLATGSASFSTTGLTLGSHTITAQYSGDGNYLAVNPTSTVVVTDFALTATQSTGQTNAGLNVPFLLNLGVTGGPLPADVVFSVSGLPEGSTYTFSPAKFAAGTAGGAVQLTITPTKNQVALLRGSGPLTVLALLGLPLWTVFRRKRAGNALLALLLLLGATQILTGCGANFMHSSPTVTATSGSVTRTVVLSLDVH